MSERTVRRNSAKHKLQSGETVVVSAGHSGSGDSIDLIGSLGFDGFWMEGEHGPAIWSEFGNMTRACDLWGMSALYRVQKLDATLIARALTLGAHGIVLPQVSTKLEAEQLVEAAKFSPVGVRGVSKGRRSYGNPDFLTRDNDETLLVVQLEDPRALENIDEIVNVEHIDVVFIAPNDLAQAMGFQGQPEHPEVAAAIDEGLRRISDNGLVAAGTNCAPDSVERFLNLGTRFLYVNYDSFITSGAKQYLNSVTQHIT